MSDSWIVQNLQNALETWNSKLNEVLTILTQSPTEFKNGAIWDVMVSINGVLQAIGFALLVLFSCFHTGCFLCFGFIVMTFCFCFTDVNLFFTS